MGSSSTVGSWEQDTARVQRTSSLVYCVVCEGGSRPWMWEPRRGTHPTPSNTISYIPHQSGRIRWPCLLFCVILSHTGQHCNMHPVLSGPFNSCLKPDNPRVQSNLDVMMHEGTQRHRDKRRDRESHIVLFSPQFNNVENLSLHNRVRINYDK